MRHIRCQNVTIITTPSNAQILGKSIPLNQHLRIHTVPFPSQEVGLPDGVESLSAATDFNNMVKIFQATTLLRPPIQHFVEQHPPDCIVTDFLFPWVDELANKLQIPRLSFNGFSLFAICAMESVKAHSLYGYASFVIPGLPHSIVMNATPPKQMSEILGERLEMVFKSQGILVNNFVELDVVPEKKGKENESQEEKEKWLPKGFEERVIAKKKGLIIKGWAPQVMILSHTVVGAFMTHCGWNSTVEAVSAGVPMITWPMHGEQFYNEKLITQVRGIGGEVGAVEWCLVGIGEKEKLVGRDGIEKVVKRLMDNSYVAEIIRRHAREFGDKAKCAAQEGGSSHRNLTVLINDLKSLRDNKLLV
ncbi:putative hexosyltransferase [Medicago truncatula]|uniref:Putative hexosyltransferase n=1 Tax=Medicago truncatula TaxID=3880 RepID=A0A072TF15_MEDTR|nr:UDP-glucosyltransferase family protein [Medicago truncatula]RHN64165.1 putative hexosyltransferase [Medicago truncatula]